MEFDAHTYTNKVSSSAEEKKPRVDASAISSIMIEPASNQELRESSAVLKIRVHELNHFDTSMHDINGKFHVS